MIDQADIYKLAGKNAKAILAIDVDTAYDEYEYSVWLKDGYIQEGYNNTIIVIDENEKHDVVEYQLSLIVKAA
tara:strand:+ start:121 stop:339 length:219 start_codon:yes stop_codon:yes gene_type:complete